MTTPLSPDPVAPDALEVQRRRAVRSMVLSLAALPANLAVLTLVVMIGAPALGFGTASVGFGTQLYYGVLAIYTGGATWREAGADRARRRGMVAAVVVGLLMVILGVQMWGYTMFGLMLVVGGGGHH